MEPRHKHRFPADNRLRDAASFSRVFDRPERSRDRLFTVLCRSNSTQAARLGLAISRKHCKRAVDRNRVKRIIRESFREHKPELAGLDFVVMNQPGTDDASNDRLFASLDEHWGRCRKLSARGKI